jgi:carboxyl-terminal processing protease
LEKSEFKPVKEADLSRHLQNGKGKEGPEDVQEKEKETLEKDYPLYQALTLLKGVSIIKK